MLRLAYFTPLPPAHTGIADYSAELLPHLTRLAVLTLFHPVPDDVSDSLREEFAVAPLPHYPQQRGQFDLALYQMGNSTHHTALYQMALRYPGVVVLHDFVLHHFVEAITRRQNNDAGYLRAFGEALGEERGSLLQFVRHTRYAFDYQYSPLNQTLVNRSLLVLVHSQFARQALQKQGATVPVEVIAQPMMRYEVTSRPQPLPWSSDCVTFATLGQVTAAKQVILALRAFARLHAELPYTRFLIIGEMMAAEVDVWAVVQELGLTEVVYVTGFVPRLDDFVNWLAAADVIINLRYPTQGETSATALRGMAQGKPVIVFDHGWYSELPDAAAIKLPPLDAEALYQALRGLALSPERRAQMGAAAARHIQSYHQPATVAAHICDVLQTYLTHLTQGVV